MTSACQIPTTADAIREFLSTREHERGYKDLRSALAGAERIVGRKAHGVPLAKSELGPLRVSRVKPYEWAAWLSERYNGLSPDSLKKGRSAVRQFLRYCVDVGYAPPEALKPVDSMNTPAGNPRTGWLRPEQVVAFNALVVPTNFPEWVCLAWHILITYGLRAEEVVILEPSALQRQDRALKVLGKGGKIRYVPVAEDFERWWAKYTLTQPVGKWMLPASDIRFVGRNEVEREVDWSRHMSQKSLRTQLHAIYDLALEEVKADRFDPLLLPPKPAEGSGELHPLSPHDLRRTMACTTLISHGLGLGGLDVRSLQRCLGHARLDTTAAYLSTADEWLGRHRVVHPTAQAAQAILSHLAGEQRLAA